MEDAGAKVGCVNSLRPRRRDAAPSMGRGTRSLTNREFWLFVLPLPAENGAGGKTSSALAPASAARRRGLRTDPHAKLRTQLRN